MRLATIHLLVSVLGTGMLLPRAGAAVCAGPILHWTDTYDTGYQEEALSVAADLSGSVYVVGSQTVTGQGANWLIRKYAPDGSVLWTQTYNNPSGNGDDYAQAVAVAPGGDVVVAGLEFTGTSFDWLIRRYSPGGVLQWSAGYNSPANGIDEPRAVAIAPTGEIWVGGYETRTDLAQGQNWRVREYSSGGGLLGSWSYDGPASGDDFVEALAVDTAGFVYVGGSESVAPPTQGFNWRVGKFDAFGGAQWTDTWNSPANEYDLVHGIAVAAGEVTVIGHEDRPDLGQSRNWRIRRYTTAGALRWTAAWDGGVGLMDDVYGLAMDPLGNAYLAGYSETAPGVSAWRTVRYSPAGAPEWVFAGSPAGSALGVAVDPAGAIAVVGFTENGTNNDFHVRRYRQPACLGDAITVTPATVTVGQLQTLVFTVTNYGGAWTGVTPQGWVTGAGSAVPVTGPSPAAASLNLGGTASFTWTFSATAAGSVTFTASASGWDDALGATVFTALSIAAVIQTPPALTGVLAVSPLSVRPGDAVTLVLTVSNSGTAAAANLRPALRPRLVGTATAYLALGPLPAGPLTLAGGSTTVFTWVFTAGLPTGSFTFSASATGADANTGAVVTTGFSVSPSVAVSSVFEPCPTAGTQLLQWNGTAAQEPDSGEGISLAPSGSIFVAGIEGREDIMRQEDIGVFALPPGGVSPYSYQVYSTAASVPDIAWGIAWLDNHEYAAVGQAAERFWLGRYSDLSGALLWQVEPVPAAGGPDVLRACAAMPGGDLVAAGSQRRTDLGQGDNLYVARYDPSGSVVWVLSYNSPANSAEAAFAVAVDPSGSIYVAGFETRPDLGQDRNVLVMKIGPNGGAPIWIRTYSSGPGNCDEARGIAVDAFGNVVVCGFETRNDLGQAENGWVGRWTTGGAAVWTTTFNSPLVTAGGPKDRAMGVALDATGSEIYVTGRVERVGQGANILFRRYAAATGTLREEVMRNGPNNKDDEGHGIARGPDGGVYITGFEDWDNLAQGTNLVVNRWNRPGCLQATLTVSPVPASIGQWFTVTLDVTSTASTTIFTLVPALDAGPGAGFVAYVSGPAPGSLASLPPGAVGSFVWTYSASGSGLVTFTGTVSGIESGSSLPVSASASATQLIQSRAALALSLAAPPTACTGQIINVVATVTNTGQAYALLDAPLPDPAIAGPGTLALVTAPGVLTSLAGGAAVSLTWTYSVTGGGSTDLTLTVTGADANSAEPLGAVVTVGPLLIGAPSGFIAGAAAPALAPVGSAFTVTLTVTNTGAGGATAIVPAAGVSPAGASVAAVGGAIPPGPVAIPSSATQTFVWTYTATGWGAATFTLTAAGADSCGTARVSATVTVLLGTPAALVAGIVAAYPDPVCTGSAVRLVVSITNTGQVPALNVRTATPYVEGLASLVSAPAWIPSLAGGASANFAWTYSPTAAGALRFTTTALGADARDAMPLLAGPLASPVLTATLPAVLDARLSAPATAIVGTWITVTLSVTNTGGQDALNVYLSPIPFPLAPVSPASSAVLIPPITPIGPVTIPPGGSQAFSFTYSISGAGPINFISHVGGDTCGGVQMLTQGASVTVTALRPATLIAEALSLTPASIQAPGTATAVLRVRNGGDAGVAVGAILRLVSGGSTTGLLGASALITPALTVTIAGNETRSFTWTHGVTLPCGMGSIIVTATGFELATGRPVASGAIASAQIAVTGPPASIAASASATSALTSSAVGVTATVRDACGLVVDGAPVAFAVLGGGGQLSVVATTTDPAGAARTSLTLGSEPGRNTVWCGVPGTALGATVWVDGTNPLLLDDPGAALDRNVLDQSAGGWVIARIYPRNDSPIVVKIFTASGRLVRTLRQMTPLARGQFISQWDGLTEDGFRVARGVYLVLVQGGGLSVVLKVVVR